MLHVRLPPISPKVQTIFFFFSFSVSKKGHAMHIYGWHGGHDDLQRRGRPRTSSYTSPYNLYQHSISYTFFLVYEEEEIISHFSPLPSWTSRPHFPCLKSPLYSAIQAQHDIS